MAEKTAQTNTAYEKVMAARDANKLTAVDYIANMFGDSFIELHGDRRYSDDKAIVAGLGMLYDTPVTVIGIEKGRNTKERMERNFGQAHPEGYRKALRLMKQAEKFRRPVLCLVDTSGAYPGIGAEERGQGQAIAENLMEMMALKTPILTILIGEGGSRIIRQPKAEDKAMFESLKLLVSRTFEKNLALSDEELTEKRYQRFRKIGNQQN